MLPRHGRAKIIKDGQPKDSGSNSARLGTHGPTIDTAFTEAGDPGQGGSSTPSAGGRRAAVVGANSVSAQDAEMQQRLERIPMLPHYAQFKRMSDDQKEEHYQRMG